MQLQSNEQESLLGGSSVYCINEGQLESSMKLANEDPESSPRIQSALNTLEIELSRNERAALAFVLIERLRTSDL